MITLHFNTLGKLVGIRDRSSGPFSSPPEESAKTLKFDPETNPALLAMLQARFEQITYVNNILRRGNVILSVNPPGADASALESIKPQIKTLMVSLRNGTAVFDSVTQQSLFYLFKAVLKGELE